MVNFHNSLSGVEAENVSRLKSLLQEALKLREEQALQMVGCARELESVHRIERRIMTIALDARKLVDPHGTFPRRAAVLAWMEHGGLNAYDAIWLAGRVG